MPSNEEIFFKLSSPQRGEEKDEGDRLLSRTPSPFPSPLWGEGKCLNICNLVLGIWNFLYDLIL
jgi:hypothetical protein